MNETTEIDAQSSVDLCVTFRPELYLQRRAWVFDMMRKERVTQVLDVGCGEGELIQCLCNAAPWLPLRSAAFPSVSATDSAPYPRAMQIEDDINEADDFLHVRNIAALDVSPEDVAQAIAFSAPNEPAVPRSDDDSDVVRRSVIRWEPLDVKLWCGGLECYNPEFVDTECIVSMEVIEHLPEDVLPDFAPMLLGVYHPRLLLITTPSYTFNARFTAPDAPPRSRQGYLDPSGRTDRIFRHSDHKFEWTVEEFTQWCQEAAQYWGYEVEVSGVGRASETDPWGRDERLGKASQVAAFRRVESEDMIRMREARCEANQILARARVRTEHQLLATHNYKQHKDIQTAKSLEEIGELVRSVMHKYQEQMMTVHELWAHYGMECGGWYQNLIAAIVTTDGLELHKMEGKSSSDWTVELKGFRPEENVVGSQETSLRGQQLDPEMDGRAALVYDGWGEPLEHTGTTKCEGTWGSDTWGAIDQSSSHTTGWDTRVSAWHDDVENHS